MKKIIILCIVGLAFGSKVHAQAWFKTYSDSTALLKNAEQLVQLFVSDINKINPEIRLSSHAIINTQPYLIFYDKNKVNLPLWNQLPVESKIFFETVGGNPQNGQKIFGLFFNGFYLPHELGHALQGAKGMNIEKNRYESEYQANIIAILWWRKNGSKKNLKNCYLAAKKMMTKLKNPVPEGQTMAEYFTENYWQKVSDPFVYGYMQFYQFIKIYEDKSLPNFDTYIKKL